MTMYVCGSCGQRTSEYANPCGSCGQTYALVEERDTRTAEPGAGRPRATLVRPSVENVVRAKTGLAPLDSALGGGFVLGSSAILTGFPGAGKSTLGLRLADALEPHGVVYGATEGSEKVWSALIGRTGRGANVPILFTQDVEDILAEVEAQGAQVVVVDNLHALLPRRDVLEHVIRLVKFAEATGRALLMIGERNYAGAIRDSASIAYQTDTVLGLEMPGVAEGSYPTAAALEARVLVTTKSRWGALGSWPLRLTQRGWSDSEATAA